MNLENNEYLLIIYVREGFFPYINVLTLPQTVANFSKEY